MQPVFRFAPSPNGHLHLGHAFSALLNAEAAQAVGGRFLVRVEDIDQARCTPELVQDALDDLRWLGLSWEEPVLRQSTRFLAYAAALDQLWSRGLLYACACTRRDIEADAITRARGAPPPRDPDGALIYSGRCRSWVRGPMPPLGLGVALRLDMARALEGVTLPLTWHDADAGVQAADPARWGDVVLARKDTPTSYHLAVVLDDAFQGVTDVVRGKDLFAATEIHRLLQVLLGLPEPSYRHHPLITDADGHKLAKSRFSTPLRSLRAEGVMPEAIRASLGFAL
ncbi:MAG: tRNA glutamyl-Q(34) synthetase GluQRS [Proteobacteria bacterium]|nr:tRNA glutamyl-Q(34) synthetase GluQRS [Pseudomonadota bacterium]